MVETRFWRFLGITWYGQAESFRNMNIVHTPLQNESLKCEATITFKLLIKINILMFLVLGHPRGLELKNFMWSIPYQEVYAMDSRPLFTERVIPKVKTITDGRSVVDVISRNFK